MHVCVWALVFALSNVSAEELDEAAIRNIELQQRVVPIHECVACSSLERAKQAAKTLPIGIVFIYDLQAETIYKYQVRPNLSVTEIVPVDKDVQSRFDALVHVNHVNPELARTGHARVVYDGNPTPTQQKAAPPALDH